MGRDNQDYFKRGGRSEGPPGPLDHFRQRFAQQQAELAREAPGRPAAWPRPMPTGGRAPARSEEPESEESAPSTASARRGEDRFAEPIADGAPPATPTVPDEPDAAEAPPGKGPEASLGPPWSTLVQRFPRLARVLAALGRLPEEPARRLAVLARRIQDTLPRGS